MKGISDAVSVGSSVVTQPLPAHVVERLGYVRFLHQEGIGQARRAHPMSSAAILSFHDAVELFYVLALDFMGVQVNPKAGFETLWPDLAKKVPNLSGRRGMERLNKIRVNHKHHGSIPGPQQIADARIDVDAFLTANTQAVFGVDYDTVTMADVVPQQPVRSKVKAAAAAEASGDRREAMGLLAEAFDELFNPHHHAYVEPSPLRFGENLTSISRLHGGDTAAILYWLRGDSKGVGYQDPRGLATQLDATIEFAATAQTALRVMTLGIDFPRYLRFEKLTPSISGTFDNPLARSYPDGYAPTEDDFNYCQQFLIEVTLRIAEVNAYLA
ncbi:hypothetical protein [Amycolatopsis sp. NPDC004378]